MIATATFAYTRVNGQIKIIPSYQGSTFEEMIQPYLIYQRAYNQCKASINKLYDYIVDVLGHDIDGQLRKELNNNLMELDNLAKQLSEYGYSGNINKTYDSIYRDVKKEIADYNNRVAIAREAYDEYGKGKGQPASELQRWSGSGFALNDGYIITNYHVVEGAKQIMVRGIRGDFSVSYSASIAAFDQYNDIALIKIIDSHFMGFGNIPYSVKNSTAEVGEDIFVLGYPLTATMGDEIKYTTGVISSKSGFHGDVSLYQISAPIQPGNSGGPLFDTEGALIGVVNAKHQGAENVGYAIKSLYVLNFVDSYASMSIIPSSNIISSLSRTEQIKAIKQCVFLVECSSEVSNSLSSGDSSNDFTPTIKNTTSDVKTVFYPQNGRNGNTTITKVELSSTRIKVYFHYVNEYDSEGWCAVNPNTYILGPYGDRQKLLNASNIPLLPEKHKFDYKGQTLDFVLEFPSLLFATEIKYFNLVEPDGSNWVFNNIIVE